MQPTLHISTGVLYLLDPIKTSGALYHSVTTSCVYDLTGIPSMHIQDSRHQLIYYLIDVKTMIEFDTYQRL